jgi:membrane-bound metal-dependent hydrolase YbcI (DUF457 family)
MPLPLAHSLAGVAVFKGLDADGSAFAWKRLLLAIFIANAADLDMIPGILVGDPNLYHHVGFSHSALFALAVALLVGLVATGAGRRWPTLSPRSSAVAGTALMVGALMLSHVLLDSLNRDLRPPGGVPMFWPLTRGYVLIYPWFVEVAKLGGEGSALDFVFSLLTAHNLYAMLWELLTLTPVIALAAWWRRRREREPAAVEGRAVGESI